MTYAKGTCYNRKLLYNVKPFFSNKLTDKRNHKFGKTLTNFRDVVNIFNMYLCKTAKEIPIQNHSSVLKCLPKATMVHKGTTISKFKNCPSVKLVTNIFSHAKKTF